MEKGTREYQSETISVEITKGILCLITILLLLMPGALMAQTGPDSVTYIDSIREDEEGGKLYFPSCIFAEPERNEIYIIDAKSRIIIYTSDLFPVYTLSKCHGIETPQGLTVDSEGNLYVAQSASKDNPRHRISVYNARLKWVRDIYIEGFENAELFIPYRLAVDKKGNIYASAAYYPGIVILSNHGQLLEVLTAEEDDRKIKLSNVTVDENGRIYLVSEEEGHIYVYDEKRKFLFKFGVKGGSSGKLSRPLAVAVDNQRGRMYVVDYMRHTVSVYDYEGRTLFEFGGLGWGEGWFQHPKDIAVDTEGRILVADTFNDRIEVFQANE
ncbi:MAG: NHL repeat-containing protein [Nitrospirota bacterium]